MKRVLGLVSVLLFIGCVESEPGANGTADVNGANAADLITQTLNKIKQYQNSVLDVECTDGNNYWRGTGTKITGGRILTAGHVVNGATNCTYYFGSARVGGSSSIPATTGDQVILTSISWNSAGNALTSVPYRTNFYPTPGEQLVLVSLPSGSSGGPVFNSNGELVAIHDVRYSDGLELNYTLPIR